MMKTFTVTGALAGGTPLLMHLSARDVRHAESLMNYVSAYMVPASWHLLEGACQSAQGQRVVDFAQWLRGYLDVLGARPAVLTAYLDWLDEQREAAARRAASEKVTPES